MNTCIYIHTYLPACMHTQIHTYTHAWLDTCRCGPCSSLCMLRIWLSARIVFLYADINICGVRCLGCKLEHNVQNFTYYLIHACVCACMHVYLEACACMRSRACEHVDANTCMRTGGCRFRLAPSPPARARNLHTMDSWSCLPWFRPAAACRPYLLTL